MTFHIYTLGCKVNSYESDVMSDDLKNHGYIEVPLTEPADISIINTCSVTNTADQKSRKIIHHVRKQNPGGIVVAVGCSIQNSGSSVDDGVADILIGNVGKSKITEFISEYVKTNEKQASISAIDHVKFETMKLNNFSKTRAFVKIQDGCNNFCSYCIIPYTRGNVRSKLAKDVLEEVNTLVKNGHKEIVLTGIHTGGYGLDLDDYGFADLLYELVQIKGLERIRISSIEITELNNHVLKLIKEYPILVDHLHIPLQSGSNTVLKRMNRKYNTSEFIAKVNEIRSIRPNISLTTDVIVGFPGETEEEFLETNDTIKRVGFSKLHVFPYSRRTGTAADTMENQISEPIKKERVHSLIALSKELEQAYFEKFIGSEMVVLSETEKDGYLTGHTGNYLTVKWPGSKKELNQDAVVKLESLEYPYLIGKKVETRETMPSH